MENLIILVDDDPVKHQPAAECWSHERKQTLQGRISANNGFPPLNWIALCGARGMLYVDAPILANRGECFLCRCAAVKRPIPAGNRYETDEQRIEARRRTWRESKRRAKERAA